MKKNIKKKFIRNEGITLIALVITIIVLLILAGVSLSAVFNQGGIFNRAEQAVDKHGQAKARETLELALGEAQMQKYEEGLTDEQLTDKINEIGEELEERENPYISQAIVDGYIFSIDRTVPKILDYLGPADGIIITAKVSGNGGWFKQGDTVNVTVTGKIKTYSGGNITNVSATKGGTAITEFSIDGEGRYTIDNITSDTTIVISATDSKDKKGSKTVPITIRIDTIPPIVDSVTSTAEGLKIKISAIGHDDESGLKQFNYTITSTEDTTLEGIPEDKRTGTFIPGQTVEITTTPTGNREETTYTITVTATDNADNTTPSSGAKVAQVTTIDGITVAEAKRVVNEKTLQEYIGKRVVDYVPKGGGIWRVFYYDRDGYFGDGSKTLYLKMDKVAGNFSYPSSTPDTKGGAPHALMLKMNPMFAKSNLDYTESNGEWCGRWRCDVEEWVDWADTKYSSYAIGAPPIEMVVRAYNLLLSGTEKLRLEWKNRTGFGRVCCEHWGN